MLGALRQCQQVVVPFVVGIGTKVLGALRRRDNTDVGGLAVDRSVERVGLVLDPSDDIGAGRFAVGIAEMRDVLVPAVPVGLVDASD